jgi:hypothetical protein
MLTTTERDLIQAANMAMDRFDRATAPVEIAKARAELERIRSKLEKARDPNTKALEVMRKALTQPIDAATGALIKSMPAPQRPADRFDKLMRPGAGPGALAK